MSIGINDKVDFLISYAARECGEDDEKMFNSLDTSGVALDGIFYKKMERVISGSKPTPARPRFKRIMIRVVVALMALMSLGFLTVMAAPTLREAFWDAIVEWYDEYVAIRYEKEETELPETTVSANAPNTIEKIMKPTYLPEGMEEEEIICRSSGVIIEYYLDDTLCFTYYQKVLQEHSIIVDNDTTTITEVVIKDNTAKLIEFKDREDMIVVWSDGVYAYCVEFFEESISMEEIIEIASSIH